MRHTTEADGTLHTNKVHGMKICLPRSFDSGAATATATAAIGSLKRCEEGGEDTGCGLRGQRGKQKVNNI